VARLLALEQTRLDADRQWLDQRRDRLQQADVVRAAAFAGLQ
jgi:hypothetical protein